MYYFDKDPKKQEKQFWKHMWDFSEENVKQTQGAFVNKEMEMWEAELRRKAEIF